MEYKMEKDITELIEILDNDIKNIAQDISVLEVIRKCLIRKDETSLSRLLDQVRSVMQNRRQNENRRFNLRRKLAEAFCCPVEKLTLSNLQTKVDEPYKTALTEKRAALAQLIEQFKAQHETTAFLLSDCARFNALLLRSIMESSTTESVTYKPGRINRSTNAAFINLQH